MITFLHKTDFTTINKYDATVNWKLNKQFGFFSRGESFIPYIDSLPAMKRNVAGPFMMPIVDKFSDMGTILIGKVESGECRKGNTTDSDVD